MSCDNVPMRMGAAVETLSKHMPQPVMDFVYRHRFHPLVRPVRNLALRSLGDTTEGLVITRGPLAGMTLAFKDAPAEWSGLHEPVLQDFLLELISPGDVVYDIGAHLGYYVLLAGRALKGNGTVVAYEPEAESYSLLERNVALNGLTELVTLRPIALGRNSGRGRVQQRGHSGEARIEVGEGEVTVGTLDEDVAAHDLAAPTIVLIDTEGMEADIFVGGWNTISSALPTLVCEHHGLKQNLVDLLTPLGYEGRDVDAEHTVFTATSR